MQGERVVGRGLPVPAGAVVSMPYDGESRARLRARASVPLSAGGG